MTAARQGEKGEALAPDIEVERRGLCEGIGDSRVSKRRDWEMGARGLRRFIRIRGFWAGMCNGSGNGTTHA